MSVQETLSNVQNMHFPNCTNTSAQMTHGFQNRTYGQQPVDQLKVQQAVAKNAAANHRQISNSLLDNLLRT
tara:strand:+ start:40 stop:252 length:213 start_codon:yes stop_codon:yes gene_type:complete